MDDKAVREALLNADCVRSAADDNSVCVSTQTYDTIRAHIEAQAAELARLKRECELKSHALDRYMPCPDHRDKVPRGVCQSCRAETAERRCAELVALIGAIRSLYGPQSATLQMKHGADPRTIAERIDALTGDDRHAG